MLRMSELHDPREVRMPRLPGNRCGAKPRLGAFVYIMKQNILASTTMVNDV